MSLYDTLTGINTTTFTLVLTLFGLTFLPWLKLNKWLKGIVRIATMLTMGYFLLVGWYTQNYDWKVPHKGEQITFPEGKFEQICNLKKLYYANGYGYRITTREDSLSFDCLLLKISENIASYQRKDKKFMKIGEVGPINSKKVFKVISSYRTGSIGLGASFGSSDMQFVILESDNRTYVISREDLDKGIVK